ANQREHALDLSGYNWVRISVTGTKGSHGHYAAAFNLDVYDASAGGLDNWLFLGDSITAAAMTHRGTADGGAWTGGDYAQLVHAAAPVYYPLQINGGVGGWTSATGAANITALMANFHGHFVSLAFGTNDANHGYPLSTAQIQAYYANMLTMIDAAQGTGAVVVVPYVPWGCKGYLGQNAWALNSYVNAHLPADRPRTVRGPDLWTAFSRHPSWMLPDCIHPSPSAPNGQLSGLEQYQRVWAQWAVATIYRPNAPAARPSPTSAGFSR
ncbi:MAG: SGNH/GDSL hydrolase family protein, partial [Nitrososphaerota archaeon]